ncbi:MAG TPA: GDSL-type esterase/lipase family protein [Polyangia bacterium]|nr:GDSL-type esterase/lipase family protein [Polyangia bacterium]
MTRSRGKALTAALLATVLALGIAELVLRVRFARRMALLERDLGGCVRASAARELIYEYTPDRCGHNSRGYFDRERERPKPPGVYRVLVIGDSVAAGIGLVERVKRYRFAGVLAVELARVRSAPLDVAVMARSGYSTGQELYLLEHEAADYQPDVIVWSYVLNDPADPFFHDANGELGVFFRRPAVQLVELVRRAWFFWCERRRGRGCPSEYHRFLHCAYADEVQRNFARIAAWSREHRVPIVMVIHALHPARDAANAGRAEGADFTDYAHYPFADLHASIARAAAAAGLTALDELDAYRGAAAADVSLPGDVWHPSARGHLLTGEWLAHQLEARGLVPR